MVLLTSLLWGLLTILGLKSPTDSPPTDLSGGSKCSGLHVTNGQVSCSGRGEGQVCQVVCDGEDQGEFTCTPEEGWTPELPTCARPIDHNKDDYDYDYAEVAAQMAGCPKNTECAKSCRRNGSRGGRCVGPTMMNCVCFN